MGKGSTDDEYQQDSSIRSCPNNADLEENPTSNVETDVVFIYMIETTTGIYDNLLLMETKVLDIIARAILTCGGFNDPFDSVSEVFYRSKAPSQTRPCTPTKTSASQCLIVDTRLTIVSDETVAETARLSALKTLERELNSDFFIDSPYFSSTPNIVYLQYLGPDTALKLPSSDLRQHISSPSSPHDISSPASTSNSPAQLFIVPIITVCMTAVILVASLLLLLTCFVRWKRQSRRSEENNERHSLVRFRT
mmetsp:Transcript_30636/g.40866  ORF Transcript_30636/g.40866 Transcript_30636/m.40866 type:complete len:251 (+) Transcript_30636:2-754(+)